MAFGFGGLWDSGTALKFTPSLPSAWEGVTLRLQRHGSRLRIDLDRDGCTVHVLSGNPVPIDHAPAGAPQGDVSMVDPGDSVHIPYVPLV